MVSVGAMGIPPDPGGSMWMDTVSSGRTSITPVSIHCKNKLIEL